MDRGLDDGTLRKWVGGVGLGAKYLYEEVPPGLELSDPENRLIWASGPLAGSGVFGAGTFNITTKSPMTHLAGSCQANGFFGAYLKFSGFDGIVIQGKSPRPSYLIVRDGKTEIRDARDLSGKDVQMVEDDLRKELGVEERDVALTIGPAGENKVLYSAIVGDPVMLRPMVAPVQSWDQEPQGHRHIGETLTLKDLRST
jgi:aldehyde:ferredoxin oxidoreductase